MTRKKWTGDRATLSLKLRAADDAVRNIRSALEGFRNLADVLRYNMKIETALVVQLATLACVSINGAPIPAGVIEADVKNHSLYVGSNWYLDLRDIVEKIHAELASLTADTTVGNDSSASLLGVVIQVEKLLSVAIEPFENLRNQLSLVLSGGAFDREPTAGQLARAARDRRIQEISANTGIVSPLKLLEACRVDSALGSLGTPLSFDVVRNQLRLKTKRGRGFV